MRFFDQHCEECGHGLEHCHGTLVLHADETVECDEQGQCGASEHAHRWWIRCAELGCGCAGDETVPELPQEGAGAVEPTLALAA